MKKVVEIGLVLLVVCSFKAAAQSYEVPKAYRFNTNEDYARYENDIIKTADWIQQTHWNEQSKKMEAATQFFLKWIKGTPAVTIKLTEAVMVLSDRNPQLGFIYMAQYSKYALQHKENFDPIQANIEALRALVVKYKNEPTRRNDNDVEELITRDKEGKLTAWLTSDFYSE
jgi:hypothetical protein